MHVNFQNEILLNRLYRDPIPAYPRSVKIIVKVVWIHSTIKIQTQHNVIVYY